MPGLEYSCNSSDYVFVQSNIDFDIWVMNALECFKHCLMRHTTSSTEEDSVDNDLEGGESVQVVSEKNFCMLHKNQCYILKWMTFAFV